MAVACYLWGGGSRESGRRPIYGVEGPESWEGDPSMAGGSWVLGRRPIYGVEGTGSWDRGRDSASRYQGLKDSCPVPVCTALWVMLSFYLQVSHLK